MKADGRMAALDGLRGIAVAAVLGYHLRLPWFEAGFLGVDLFFVISGFIITLKLLQEHRATGGIELLHFYERRLWRLYPAALVLILLAFPLTALLAPEALHRLAADAPAAFIYLSNAWQLASTQSYFETMGRDPVLRHLWSLALEQHFYLLWPLLMVYVLRRRSVAVLALLALGLALGSAAEMTRLYAQSPLHANFAYLASHTHAMGLFLGAALAGGVSCWQTASGPERLLRGAAMLAPLGGVSALAGLGAMVWGTHAATPWLFQGGFLLASGLSALLIVSTLASEGWWTRGLGSAPLRWLGTRSYSIYLWHWPLCVWVFEGPGDVDLSRTLLVVVLSGLLGELSFRFVEQGARPTIAGWRSRFSPLLNGLSLWIGTAASLFLAQLAVPALVSASAPPLSLESAVTALSVSQSTLVSDSRVGPEPDAAAAAHAAPLVAQAVGQDITIIGDSVMLTAAHRLRRVLVGSQIDAAVGRQFSEAPRIIAELRSRGALGATVVLHLGTNGYIVERHLREALRQLEDRSRVVLVDVHAARRWTEQNNEVIARVAPAFPNVVVMSWAAIGRDNPQYFVQDGIHPSSTGMAALARALVQVTDAAPMTEAFALQAQPPRSRRGAVGGVPTEPAAALGEGDARADALPQAKPEARPPLQPETAPGGEPPAAAGEGSPTPPAWQRLG